MKKKLLIGIDDTDALGTKGTGAIAQEMTEIIEKEGWGSCGFITRHQLLLHPDIPYTSHNSAMVFNAEVEELYIKILTEALLFHLKKESALSSDPGICILELQSNSDKKALIEFGYRAKDQVLTKDQAYKLANKLEIFLEERGGTGIGVIGALAGVGLRLDGNDGEMKGGLPKHAPGTMIKVGDLREEKIRFQILDLATKAPLEDNAEIFVTWKLKPLLYYGELTLLVEKDEETGLFYSLEKREMRKFGDERASIKPCHHFRLDVIEETVYTREKSCFNCIFRRWTADAFTCEFKDVSFERCGALMVAIDEM